MTAVPNWTVGETFSIGSGESFRIIEIETEIDEKLLEQGVQRHVHRRALLRRPRVSPSTDFFSPRVDARAN